MAFGRAVGAFVCLGTIAGCGGSTTAAPADASPDVTSIPSNDGSSDLAAPDAAGDATDATDASCHLECPLQPPAVGSPCTDLPSELALVCDYPIDASADTGADGGADADEGPARGCADEYICLSGQFEHGTNCPARQPAACPATLADVPVGQPCGFAGMDCMYPGTLCACLTTEDGGGPDWFCDAIDPQCPPLPPLEGTACTPLAVSCSYGENMCANRGFGFFECPCGIWQQIPWPPCPPRI
jgi:hypothetical protein